MPAKKVGKTSTLQNSQKTRGPRPRPTEEDLVETPLHCCWPFYIVCYLPATFPSSLIRTNWRVCRVHDHHKHVQEVERKLTAMKLFSIVCSVYVCVCVFPDKT